MLNWNWVLLLAGGLMILIEVLLGGFAGFDLVLIGSAFVLGGIVGMAIGNPLAGFITASLLCIAYITLGRRWVRDRVKTQKVATNVDALIGQQARVTLRVAEHEAGQVKVKDETWRAVPASGATGPFETGSVVTVAGVEGVTLQVKGER
jgi:membrane protein implicated in regulation of membrane protease activity